MIASPAQPPLHTKMDLSARPLVAVGSMQIQTMSASRAIPVVPLATIAPPRTACHARRLRRTCTTKSVWRCVRLDGMRTQPAPALSAIQHARHVPLRQYAPLAPLTFPISLATLASARVAISHPRRHAPKSMSAQTTRAMTASARPTVQTRQAVTHVRVHRDTLATASLARTSTSVLKTHINATRWQPAPTKLVRSLPRSATPVNARFQATGEMGSTVPTSMSAP